MDVREDNREEALLPKLLPLIFFNGAFAVAYAGILLREISARTYATELAYLVPGILFLFFAACSGIAGRLFLNRVSSSAGSFPSMLPVLFSAILLPLLLPLLSMTRRSITSAAPARPPAVLLRAEYSFHPETGSARPFAAPFCNSLSGRGIFRHSLCGSGSQFRRHSASAPPDRSLSGNSLPDSPPASAEKNAAVHSAASYGIAFLGGINPYRLRLSGTAPRSCRSSAGQRCNPNRHPLWTRRAAASARQTLSDHK